jgi:hypothetical protein
LLHLAAAAAHRLEHLDHLGALFEDAFTSLTMLSIAQTPPHPTA